MKQFGDDSLRHCDLTEELGKKVDLTDEDKVAER